MLVVAGGMTSTCGEAQGGISIVDLCGMAKATADMFSLTVQATEHPLRVNRDSARALVLAIPDRLAGGRDGRR
jgi:hypothetical protein